MTLKPYTILQTRSEADGATGVLYAVVKSEFIASGKTNTKELRGYLSVPQGQDVDDCIHEYLTKAGWI